MHAKLLSHHTNFYDSNVNDSQFNESQFNESQFNDSKNELDLISPFRNRLVNVPVADSPKRYQSSDISASAVDINHPDRLEVETFIYNVFKAAYGAEITLFMPNLVALRDKDNILMGAFGLKPASNGPLFLEQYLDEPIEALVSKNLGKTIKRSQITKIGNLAVANPRNAGVLIAHVIQHSLNMGIEWCVATAHHSLQNGVVKGGRDVYPLFPADKARLTLEEQAKWGSYYDRMPQVVAIRGVAID
jgi:Thermostable hemolysin